MEDRRFSKIEITKKGKIHLIWQKRIGEKLYDEFHLLCSEPALPEFYTAVKELNVHVIDMCELPDHYLDRITVKGVSFSYSGKRETLGAVITAAMKLNYAVQPLNLNTPHKTVDSYSDDAVVEEMLLTGDCIDALDKVVREAFRYLDGNRAQMKLFTNKESA